MTSRRAAALLLCASTLTLAALTLPGCREREAPLDDLRYLGNTRMGTGQYDQAAVHFQDFIDRRPGDPYIRGSLGRAYLKSGKPDQAAEHLRIAYSQRPHDIEILNDLCESLVQSKQYDEAFSLLRTNAADRGDVADHIRLGKYALRMGDTDTARVALLTAARIDKGRTVAPQLALCDFHAAINDKPAAMRRLRGAYWLAPRDTEVLERCRGLVARGANRGGAGVRYAKPRPPASRFRK